MSRSGRVARPNWCTTARRDSGAFWSHDMSKRNQVGQESGGREWSGDEAPAAVLHTPPVPHGTPAPKPDLKPGYVGAGVWYWYRDMAGKLYPMPADLLELQPNGLWSLNAQRFGLMRGYR